MRYIELIAAHLRLLQWRCCLLFGLKRTNSLPPTLFQLPSLLLSRNVVPLGCSKEEHLFAVGWQVGETNRHRWGGRFFSGGRARQMHRQAAEQIQHVIAVGTREDKRESKQRPE